MEIIANVQPLPESAKMSDAVIRLGWLSIRLGPNQLHIPNEQCTVVPSLFLLLCPLYPHGIN